MSGEGREAYVQVATDGSGKKIRNVQLDVVQADGTVATVQMQVVVPVDKDGQLIDHASETNALLKALLREMTALRRMYGRATGQQFIALDGAMADDFAID